MKVGAPLLVSGVAHLGLLWAFAVVGGPARPPIAAERELIVFEPTAQRRLPARAEPEPAEPPQPEPPQPEPPQPEPAEPITAEPTAARPAPIVHTEPAASEPSPVTVPDSPPTETPRRLDLTLSNTNPQGRGGSGHGADTGGSGRGTGEGARDAADDTDSCREAATKAQPRERVTIAYPAAARAAGLEGRVVLQARVDARGEVRSVTVLESAGPEIDEPARAALKRWRFEPGTRCGVAVETSYVIAREFRLGD